MAADGIRVLGRVVAASDGALAVARNANEILDEADAAFAGFLAAVREFAAANPDLGLAAEEPTGSADLAATVAEVDSLDLRRESVAAIVWATGTTPGCESSSGVPGAGPSSSAGSPRCRGSTSWACTGCTRSSPACSLASAATRSTSSNT
jgi:hypothetical protein